MKEFILLQRISGLFFLVFTVDSAQIGCVFIFLARIATELIDYVPLDDNREIRVLVVDFGLVVHEQFHFPIQGHFGKMRSPSRCVLSSSVFRSD